MNPPVIQSTNPPALLDLLNQLRQKIFTDLNCHEIGSIVSWDKDTQTAQVQIAVLRLIGDKQVTYPLLTHCPVLVLSGGAGRITFPIAAGDSCLVFFNDRDLDNWFASGVTAVPNSFRTHSLSDGLVIVGFRNMANKLLGISSTDTELGQGGTVIGMDGAKISVRNDATSLKAALDALFTNLNSLMTTLAAWVNTGGSTPNPATITALTTVQTSLTATKAVVDLLLK